MSHNNRIDTPTLAQATTDALTALALVVARVTQKKGEMIERLNHYAGALEKSGQNDAGAQLVREMARVVNEIRD